MLTQIATCEHARPIAQRQTCKCCGRQDGLDFHVPDDVWAAAVPTGLRNQVVCLKCFDGYAAASGTRFAASLRKLYFAGEAASLELLVIRGVDADG